MSVFKMLFLILTEILMAGVAQAEVIEMTTAPLAHSGTVYSYPRLYHLETVLGITTSHLSGLDANHQGSDDTINGLVGGVDVLFGRGQWQFETGLLKAERGGNETTSTDKAALQLKYLEVPLLVNYSFSHPLNTHLFVKGGMVLAYLQDAKRSLRGQVDGEPDSEDVKSSFEDFDPRIQIGFGGRFKLAHGFFWVVEADYQRSIQQISRFDSQTTDFYYKVYNESLGVMTGMSFDL